MIIPGAITLAVMPLEATSFASDFVKPSTPALLALYTDCPALPLLPKTLPEIKCLFIFSLLK